MMMSLPLRRQNVVTVLAIATVLFIIYQLTFIAELNKSSKSAQPASQRRPSRLKHHPRDISIKAVVQVPEQPVLGSVDRKENQNLEKPETVNRGQSSPLSDVNFFKCLKSEKMILIERVNDDYCDCPDGSDEPQTNACPDGKFSCLTLKKSYPSVISSAWVNDGVCDCCDGSDEWKKRKVDSWLPLQLQIKIGHYLSPCPNLCPSSA